MKLLAGWRVRAALALLALCMATAVPAQPSSGVSPIMSVLEAPPDDELSPGQIADPWESFNRAMFRFNQDVDRDLLLPWTDAYLTLVPEVARIGVGNFFANAQDLWSSANNLMQGKFQRSVMMTMRFATNTVLGAFGLIDIATAVGMERWPEDFGQTLGVWGMPPGPYLVLPVFGPSTVRDAVGLAAGPGGLALLRDQRSRVPACDHRARGAECALAADVGNAGAGRHRPGQIQLRARRLPQPASAPGVRRQPARRLRSEAAGQAGAMTCVHLALCVGALSCAEPTPNP